jgi:hypothetical protein
VYRVRLAVASTTTPLRIYSLGTSMQTHIAIALRSGANRATGPWLHRS